MIDRLRPGDVIDFKHFDGVGRKSIYLIVSEMPRHLEHLMPIEYSVECIRVDTSRPFYIFSRDVAWKFIEGHDDEMR
jgi:hypothetical protein